MLCSVHVMILISTFSMGRSLLGSLHLESRKQLGSPTWGWSFSNSRVWSQPSQCKWFKTSQEFQSPCQERSTTCGRRWNRNNRL